LALVALSVVEQRLDAVRAVLSGASVSEVAAGLGTSRQTIHTWLSRYLSEGLPGLADRSHRPRSSPQQVEPAVEVRVAELRRGHPRWGATRIRMEMLKAASAGAPPMSGIDVPSTRTVNRILIRQGLLAPCPRKRPRESYRRWERPGPMQLWAVDIVGGVMLVDPRTGVLREAKVVTGVDDHSRYCVMAAVVERATGRAVCLALAAALSRFGVPGEILSDNGRQFTDRFGKGGEVLFDKICRKNGIQHRLTAPASPNQNGKVERFHGTLRRELLDDAEPFTSLELAQQAVDAWVREYNHERPHQGLDGQVPVSPAQRFTPTGQAERDLLPLWLPPTLASNAAVDAAPEPPLETVVPAVAPAVVPTSGSSMASSTASSTGAVEFDRVVPPSGNMVLVKRQIWLGPARAGLTVRFWVDCDLIHLLIGGARVKTLRSHLSVNDLAQLTAAGAVPAGPSPLPAPEPARTGSEGSAQAFAAVEVERSIARNGRVCLAGQSVPAAEILAGRHVGIRIEPATLMFFDLDTRELLRTRANPLTAEQIARLRGSRPAGPPPRPATEPVRVQRRASNTGIVMVVGQKVALGRVNAYRTVTIAVSETTLAIELDDGEVRVVRRTTTLAVRNIKANRPWTVPSVS
jgi:transposase InsO family protein